MSKTISIAGGIASQAASLKQLSLVSTPGVDVPPPAERPLSLLNPLERALVDHDLASVKSLLRDGADPYLVCPVRLASAGASDESGLACARVIQVASRMKRMNLPTAGAHAGALQVSEAVGCRSSRAGPLQRLMGRFSIGKSANAGPIPVGPIVQALNDHDIEGATRALNKAGSAPRKLNITKHQDRLVGMLALNDTQKLAVWHGRGLLHPRLQSETAQGLKTVLKQFSYRKVEPGQKKLVQLNGAAEFHTTKERILCRHLATRWLLHRPVLENGKIDYATFSSKENLQEVFKEENQLAFEYYKNNCTNAHLVENGKWGTFLAGQFREMQSTDGGAKPKRILIGSESHAMACELTIKKNGEGSPTYAVNFYDPNATASHRRVRTQDLAEIQCLTMRRQINHRGVTNAYFKDQSLTMAFVISDQMAQPAASDRPVTSLNANIIGGETEAIANRKFSSRPVLDHLNTPALSGSGKKPDAGLVLGNYLYHVMREGFSGEVPSTLEAISKTSDSEKQVAILTKARSNGIPTLEIAMTLGYEQSVAAYTSGVLAMDTLSGEQKATVLSQRSKGRKPLASTGFQGALALDQTGVVHAFTRIVLASDALSPDQKCHVLNVKAGKSCFLPPCIPFERPSGAAKAFIDAVNQSGLAPELRWRLLAGN